MNKEIEEMLKIFNDVNVVVDYNIPCLTCKEEGKEEYFNFLRGKQLMGIKKLYDAGYRKIDWNKVTDKLPEDISDILLAIKTQKGIMTTTGNYRLNKFYISDLGSIDKDKVVAWAELPKYGEEKIMKYIYFVNFSICNVDKAILKDDVVELDFKINSKQDIDELKVALYKKYLLCCDLVINNFILLKVEEEEKNEI